MDAAIWELVAVTDENLKQLLQAITVEMSFDRKVQAFASLLIAELVEAKGGRADRGMEPRR